MDLKLTGDFIAECRKEKQLTQKQLGEKLHVTDRAVSKWERGKSFPDAGILENLCRELGISVSELLAGKRIQPEDYHEETERLLAASIGSRQLYSIQIIIYILTVIAVVLIYIPFLARGDAWLPAASLPNLLCWLSAVLLAFCGSWLDKAAPDRMFRISSVWIEGIAGGLSFIVMEALIFVNIGIEDLMAADPGERLYLFLLTAGGLILIILVRVSRARTRRKNL